MAVLTEMLTNGDAFVFPQISRIFPEGLVVDKGVRPFINRLQRCAIGRFKCGVTDSPYGHIRYKTALGIHL